MSVVFLLRLWFLKVEQTFLAFLCQPKPQVVDKILSLCHGSKGPWLEVSSKVLSQVMHGLMMIPGQCSHAAFKAH